MGAWGAGILQNDAISDITYEYKTLLAYDVDCNQAFDVIKKAYLDDYTASDEEDSFWYAIAHVNWLYGRKDDYVLKKTLELIDDEKYMEVWLEQGQKKYEARKAALANFKEKILFCQRPYKKAPKPMMALRMKTKFQKGDLIAYQLGSSIFPEEMHSYFKNTDLYCKWIIMCVMEIGSSPVSKLMPELDYHSFAGVALYNQCFFNFEPTEVPDNLELGKIYSPSLNNNPVLCDIMWLDEFCNKITYSKTPRVNVIGKNEEVPKWGLKGYSENYRGIDRIVDFTYSILKNKRP